MPALITWTEKQQAHQALWLTHNQHKPPQSITVIDENINADAALKLAYANTAMLWRGDFHQAKQLLAAIKRRLQNKKSKNPEQSLAARFHQHRMQQGQNSRILSSLLIEISPDWQLNLPRAPQIKAALQSAQLDNQGQNCVMPLHNLLGYIGAHEWYQKGVVISVLDEQRIHVPFGVFSPLRGEYLDLVNQAPLPNPCQTAFDIGTGSGVLAAVLAKRGIANIIGTDTNPLAIDTAHANAQRLGFAQQIRIIQQNLLPEGMADLIVCNPPWLPAKPSSAIESALYDPDSQMLLAVLEQAGQHLNPNGQLWIVMSDLAEHLHLRDTHFLNQVFTKHGWQVHATHQTKPTHPKSNDASDPLAMARNREATSLYVLTPLTLKQS